MNTVQARRMLRWIHHYNLCSVCEIPRDYCQEHTAEERQARRNELKATAQTKTTAAHDPTITTRDLPKTMPPKP